MMRRFVFLLFVCLFFMNFTSATLYYEATIRSENRTLSLVSLDVVYSRIPFVNPVYDSDSLYTASLYDSNDELLLSEDFVFESFELHDYYFNDTNEYTQELTTDSFEGVIYFPYVEDVSLIIFEKDGASVLVVDDVFVLVRSNDVFDEDLSFDETVVDSGSFLTTLYLFLIILVLVLCSVALYFYFARKRHL